MAKMSEFTDSFNYTSVNTSLWTSFGSAITTNISRVNGSLLADTTTALGYGGYDGVINYDLTGSFALMLCQNAGNQSLASLEVIPVQVTKDANNKLFWYINTNNVTAYKTVASVQTSVATAAYSTATMKWFKIREAGGTIFYDYSADGVNWTNLGNLANPFVITAMQANFSVGTFANEASATRVVFDNFNLPPYIGVTGQHILVGDGMSRGGS